MRITIVGAGFSGSVLASQLASTEDGAPDICLVGVGETFARGVAYGQARPEHLLNVRAGHLGVHPDAPGDFAAWLSLGPRGRDEFLPRVAYGDYLAERLREAHEVAGNLSLVRQEAIAISRVGEGYRVHLDDGGYFASDRVVLALGALPPQRLAGIGPRLAQSQRYIGWPWQDDALERIEADARVLIVGTGLTMADVVSTLAARGHRGELTAISRHGLLPRAHADVPGPVIELPPSVRQALGGRDVRALLAAVRSLVHVAPDWRSVVDGLRPHTQAFWRSLPDTQRARFLRHLRSHWEVARHRIAPRVAEVLDTLQASGQLRVRAARLLRAGLRAHGAEVLLQGRGQEHADVSQYDYVIRATGLDTDIVRTTHPLVSHLVDAGLLTPDPHGLGVEVGDDLQVRDRHGTTVRGLYCLGPLLRGRLWEITAVPELRSAAAALASTLRAGVPSSVRRKGDGLARELLLSAGL
ncbi:FAD/NAD(P)-binding protein [Pseudoxanthomonas sp. PXM02]|uniref:FAD/NAD(P)-binding protein n=1 Tax=Pseudoxanthomonas sp. PXM02 TaxID=2769294 RepID=UPI00178009CC|nr:FAD/NAD(P)-binding protein [Pseudoxanthomonas sp. PXM02]MBD9478630.1 FAD/NAD(P)-binding protein [Pseudoxanthomonas sp. PXM02]